MLLNRRQFHLLSAATALQAAFAENFHSNWKLGVTTDQIDLNLSFALNQFLPKYGLHRAEIRYLLLDGKKSYVYTDATPAQLKQVKRQLDDADVKLSVLDTAIYKITLPGTTAVGEMPAYVDAALNAFPRQMEDLKRAADAAHILGTDRLRIFTFRRVANPATVFNRVVDELYKAIAVARQQDVSLLIENEYDTNVATGREIADLFKAIPDRRLMHNWDPCNDYIMGEQPFPASWNELDHTRITNIHLKDAKGKDWKPIGSGEVDLLGQFKALKAINYSGTLSLETRYQGEREGHFESSVESMNGLLAILKKV